MRMILLRLLPAALLLGANPGWSPTQVWSAIQGDATTGVVTDTRGSPNLLLHVGNGGGPPPPPPMAVLP